MTEYIILYNFAIPNLHPANVMKKFMSIILLSVEALLFLLPCNVFAKSDKENYHIFWDDVPKNVASRYNEAFMHSGEPWVLEFADSLEHMANSKKPEFTFFATELRCHNAYMNGDSLKFLNLSEKTRNLALKFDYRSLYFGEMMNLVEFYRHAGDFYQAKYWAHELIKEGKEFEDKHALYFGHMALGAIISARHDYRRSNEQFETSLEYLNQMEGKNQLAASSLQTRIALNCLNAKEFQKSLKYALMAEENGSSEIFLPAIKATCYFELDDSENFKKELKKYYANTKGIDRNTDPFSVRLNIQKLADDGNYDLALEKCKELENDDEYTFKSMIYRKMGLWEEAYKCAEIEFNIKDSINATIVEDELSGMTTDLETITRLQEMDEKIMNQRTWIILGFSIFIILIVIALVVWARIRSMKRMKEMLERTNAELKKARDIAENSNSIKTQFLQNMSHEIRTPLNAIVGFAQLLGLPDGINTEEEKTQYNDYIRNNSNMLQMLIDDILDLADVENGNYRIDMNDASVNEICNSSIKSVEYRTPDGVRMYFTSEVDNDYKIFTDARRVQQVLINYLSNSCKHTERGEIHLHCSKTENPGHITFSVTDTGTGVPADMAENIFERFTKLNAFKQGTGLGLNICRTVAEKLGGVVKLDTSYTDGARFVFIVEDATYSD